MQSLNNKGSVYLSGERNSNLELLRLICMIMVLILHSFGGYTHGNGIPQAIDIFINCSAICAVNVFLLISGFFGIRWKLKSLFNLLFQIFFYAFAVYGVAALLGVIDFSLSGLLRNITCLYTHWWFITDYLLLYLCAPLLNAFVQKSTKEQLLGFIIILVISMNCITRSYGILHFCTIYLIGRYIAVNKVVGNSWIKPGWFYWCTTILIFILVYVSFRLLHIEDPGRMQSLPWGLDYAAPLVILQSLFLFIWFARLNFHSRLINWLAVSCLSVYFIHMHPAIKQIGYYNYTESLYSLPVFEHMWKLALLIIVVFFGSIFIDKVRIVISTLCYKVLLWIIKVTKLSETNILLYIPNQVNNVKLFKNN